MSRGALAGDRPPEGVFNCAIRYLEDQVASAEGVFGFLGAITNFLGFFACCFGSSGMRSVGAVQPRLQFVIRYAHLVRSFSLALRSSE